MPVSMFPSATNMIRTTVSEPYTVGEHEYVSSKMRARDASWIVGVLMQKGMMTGSAAGQFTGLPTGLAQASKEEWDAIQGLCLACCSRVIKGSPSPIPVFTLPDTWSFEELAYDLTTVMQLSAHALVYNISPFFEQGGLSLLMQVLGRLNLSPPTT